MTIDIELEQINQLVFPTMVSTFIIDPINLVVNHASFRQAIVHTCIMDYYYYYFIRDLMVLLNFKLLTRDHMSLCAAGLCLHTFDQILDPSIRRLNINGSIIIPPLHKVMPKLLLNNTAVVIKVSSKEKTSWI